MIHRLSLLALALFSIPFTTVQLSGCKKEVIQVNPPVCDVKGIYTGTSTTSTGVTSPMTYRLEDNNFAIGTVTPKSEDVTFGGYKNSCDSITLSVHYNTNRSYYLLKGRFLNNRATISGTYKNLTTPSDFGTFTISK
jgi:hypothetical protein